MTIVGAIRKNKPELPPEFTRGRRPAGSSLFGFQPDRTIVLYYPKNRKVVTLLSTLHHDDKPYKENKNKPEIVITHSATGVDCMDQMTRRWPLVVFYNKVDISAMNTDMLCLSLNGNQKLTGRRKFLTQLGRELAGVGAGSQESDSTVDSTPLRTIRKRCSVCPRSKGRKYTLICCNCKQSLCYEHSRILCFNQKLELKIKVEETNANAWLGSLKTPMEFRARLKLRPLQG